MQTVNEALLNQLAVTLPPKPRLMEGLALFTRGPEASLEHPRSQCLSANLDPVPFVQGFDGQRGSEVPVLGSDQLESVLNTDTLVHPMVGSSASSLMDQPAATIIPVARQQPANLPHTQGGCGRKVGLFGGSPCTRTKTGSGRFIST